MNPLDISTHSPSSRVYHTFLVATALLFNQQALAHPGHDHEAPTSMLTHVLFYGSLVAVVALILLVGYKYYTKSSK